MLSLFAAPYTTCMLGLGRAYAFLSTPYDPEGLDQRESIASRLFSLHRESSRMPVSDAFRERIRRLAERATDKKFYPTNQGLVVAVHDLGIDFLNELDASLFLALPRDGAISWLRPHARFSTEVNMKFAIARRDLDAAVKCFALEEWTASVFHCMRAMELGLRWMADKLNVPFTIPFEYQDWHNIIEGIENEIRKRERALPRGQAKSEELTFYSSAAHHFFFTKEAWRNHVSHSRTFYGEADAKKVLDSVRDFLAALAPRVDP